VVEWLVANFFWSFGVQWELHTDQGRNFESRLMQEVLQCLEWTRHAPHPCTCSWTAWPGATSKQSRNPTSSRRIAPEGLGQQITHLPSCLQGNHLWHYGLAPGCLVFGREFRLLCDLLFGVTPDKQRRIIGHATNLLGHLHVIQNYARQNLKMDSNRMKIR
jgi:hypothetical protein